MDCWILFWPDKMKFILFPSRIKIRLQYQFIVCECLLNCFQSSHFSLRTRKCLNYWRIINLKLGNRDVGIGLQLCLVSGQGKKVFIVLNEGLLGSQIFVKFLLRLWAVAAPEKHCYYPNSSRQISFYLNWEIIWASFLLVKIKTRPMIERQVSDMNKHK